jgi:hypothetical protein
VRFFVLRDLREPPTSECWQASVDEVLLGEFAERLLVECALKEFEGQCEVEDNRV